MRTFYEIDANTPGHWRAVNDRRWMEADGAELTCSDPSEFETWLAQMNGQAVWSPTGPATVIDGGESRSRGGLSVG